MNIIYVKQIKWFAQKKNK